MTIYGFCQKKQIRIKNGKVVNYCWKISCKHLFLKGERDEREYLSIALGNDYQPRSADSGAKAVVPGY